VPDQAKVNARLLDGPADWISPGYDDEIFRDGRPVSRWLLDPPPAGEPASDAAFEPARLAMGDTRRYTEKINLNDMTPYGELSSVTLVLPATLSGPAVLHLKGTNK
jgi:hypothetical protein